MYYLLAVSVIAWYGCGESPTKSEHEALEARVAVLEEVFLSNVVLNTEAHVVAVGGSWAVFGGTVAPSYNWRLQSASMASFTADTRLTGQTTPILISP